MPSKLALGTIALGLSTVASYRQKVMMTEKEATMLQVVDAITVKLQNNDFAAYQNVIREIAEITPGAQDSFKDVLGKVSGDIQGNVLQNIKKAQNETQSKLNDGIAALSSANGAADESKKVADSGDQALFDCVAEEKNKTKAVEDAGAVLAEARQAEQAACKAQQDGRPFAYASGATPSFSCDLGVDSQCDQELAQFEASLDQMMEKATSELGADQEKYNALKAECDKRKQETAAAQEALTFAENAWTAQNTQCEKLKSVRTGQLCGYGTAVQAKCAAQGEYLKLVGATNQAGNESNVDSEVDRIKEWRSATTTKCMLGKSAAKGLSGAVGSEELNECQATEAQYAEAVGTLDRHDKQLDSLSGSNPCEAGPISFYNGQEWTVGKNAASSDYTQTEFKPVLQLEGPPFPFCT